jgi:hypothetical protein
MLVLYREFVSLTSIQIVLILTIAVKQCMDIGARPDVCFFIMFLIFGLTLKGDSCCAWFTYPVLVLVSRDGN